MLLLALFLLVRGGSRGYAEDAQTAANSGAIDAALLEFERAVALAPNDPTAHFNLSVGYLRSRRRFREAVAHYDEAKQLGFAGDPKIEKLVEMFRDQRRTLEYIPKLSADRRPVTITLNGNAHTPATKDNKLVHDILQYLEVAVNALGHGMFTEVRADLREIGPQWGSEEWTVKGIGFEETFPVRLVQTPGGGTDIILSIEKETFVPQPSGGSP